MQKVRDYDKISNSLGLKFLKGFLIGISVIIPGFCTALLAMTLNEYQSLLEVIESFYRFKILKKHSVFIIGIFIGIIFIVLLMNYLFSNYNKFLECFFLGIAIGGLFKISKFIKKANKVDYLVILIGILLSILPELLPLNSTINSNLVLIILGGILSSLGFIMPGVSGSMILLSIGVYPIIIKSFSDCLMIFKEFPENGQIINCVTFLISFVLASIMFSKLIKKVINKYEKIFIVFCIGLLIGTIGLIFKNIVVYEFHFILKIIITIMGILLMKIFK